MKSPFPRTILVVSLSFLVFFAVLLTGCVPADKKSESGTVALVVTNYDSLPIYYLYITPSGSLTWGPDQLGTSTIPQFGQVTLSGIACPEFYDLWAEISDGFDYYAYSQSFACGFTYYWDVGL